MTREQITVRGIKWVAAKQKKGDKKLEGLIEWSPRLRQRLMRRYR